MSHIHARGVATIEDAPGRAGPLQSMSDGLTDVVGEFSFDAPMTADELAALERSYAWCFATHRVQVVRVYLACNRRRAVLLFRAPDAESVRLACRHVEMPVDRVWPCREMRAL